MARLSIFIGIGFVLVGLFGLFISPLPMIVPVLAALGGFFMIIAGLICIGNYKYSLPMSQVALSISGFLLVIGIGGLLFCLAQIQYFGIISAVVMADIAILAGLFWLFGFNIYEESAKRRKLARMAEANKSKLEELGVK